ncbi:hypothetical protein AAEX37_01252 [Oligella sp. MSHR50489EDL]
MSSTLAISLVIGAAQLLTQGLKSNINPLKSIVATVMQNDAQ